MRFLSGFESTHIFGSGTDVLQTTRHTELVEDDLKLVKTTGLTQMRYSVPWHSIERRPGKYDWRWMDKAMAHLQEMGIEPILDPLHHTSFPKWLGGGFANPDFAELYLKFCTAIADRYPWVRHYTVVNEPFVTTWFCGHEACWYPFFKGPKAFVPMLMNVVEAIVSVSRMLVEKRPDVCLIHVDAAERHRNLDEASREHAEFGNNIRFLVQDMILGRVGAGHALHDYLATNGADEERLARFREEPGRIDVIGLDYYSHCELEWTAGGRIYPNKRPKGLVPTAVEYAERYKLPIMLSETNIRGYVSDRISWLKFMVEQCEQIELETAKIGVPFEGFCWYPFIDSTDWCSLVKTAKGCIDPQGDLLARRQTQPQRVGTERPLHRSRPRADHVRRHPGVFLSGSARRAARRVDAVDGALGLETAAREPRQRPQEQERAESRTRPPRVRGVRSAVRLITVRWRTRLQSGSRKRLGTHEELAAQII